MDETEKEVLLANSTRSISEHFALTQAKYIKIGMRALKSILMRFLKGGKYEWRFV